MLITFIRQLIFMAMPDTFSLQQRQQGEREERS